MADERFMRHHYGASGYVDPHIAYDLAYQEFEKYWNNEPIHIRRDMVLRAVAASAFVYAKGFHLGSGKRVES